MEPLVVRTWIVSLDRTTREENGSMFRGTVAVSGNLYVIFALRGPLMV